VASPHERGLSNARPASERASCFDSYGRRNWRRAQPAKNSYRSDSEKSLQTARSTSSNSSHDQSNRSTGKWLANMQRPGPKMFSALRTQGSTRARAGPKIKGQALHLQRHLRMHSDRLKPFLPAPESIRTLIQRPAGGLENDPSGWIRAE
jgi:hypothetical protein